MQVQALSLVESAPAALPEPVELSSRHPPAQDVPPCWTARLLGTSPWAGKADGLALVRAEATRFAGGLGLAALYGLSLGMRQGGTSLFVHAAGVPLAIFAIAALGVPALYIVLTLFDVPIDTPRVLSATARASAYTGIVLGGLAPAAALFVVSTVSRVDVAIIAGLGLITAGAIGLTQFLRHVHGSLAGAGELTRSGAAFTLTGFAIFATALAARIWWSFLPVIGGVL